jgi:hypothetical protein
LPATCNHQSYYLVNEDGTETLIRKETKHVGKQISTKAVGSDSLNDITSLYKHTEGVPFFLSEGITTFQGTTEERAAHQGGEGEEGERNFAVVL